MAKNLRILVSGMVAADPGQGGATWAVLQYVLGFRALGHEAYLIEPVHERSIQPGGAPLVASANATYFRDVVGRFGLDDCAALLQQETHETVGLPYASLLDIAGDADVLFNVSGMLTDADIFGAVPCRVYVDLDPAFNQLWHAVQGIDMRFDGHTHFVTVGLAIGTAECSVPICGAQWHQFLQPVVLAEWPYVSPDARAPWTTIANWRGYGSIEHEGVLFGQKAHSLRRFIALPSCTKETLELALAIHHDETRDLEALHANGWRLADPSRVAGTPDTYRQFIQQSKGELGIAKSGYVHARCGWFSDRSACYLASGRPVIAQDTGVGAHLPLGRGLLAFSTMEEAADTLERVSRDYERHSRCARALAEEHFDSNRVLPSLLAAVGA